MLEYFEGELICIWFNNLTPVIAKKALEGLRLLHQLGIYHGDIYQSQCTILRNVMVSKEGDVKWIDFERSWLDSSEERLDEEYSLALCLWDPCNGRVWKS
jgi:predicted Ser/Thr protein kinase